MQLGRGGGGGGGRGGEGSHLEIHIENKRTPLTQPYMPRFVNLSKEVRHEFHHLALGVPITRAQYYLALHGVSQTQALSQ